VDWFADGLSALNGLTSASVFGVPVTMAAMVPFGGLALAAKLRQGDHAASPTALTARRPGWVARRRAVRGIVHPPGRVGVGYVSATKSAHLDLAQLNHHGYIGGAPGSGKSSLLRLLIQGYPGPVIALDAKGSPELADTVWGLPGHVWEIGGPLKLDLLDPEPAILAQQLLEGETFTDRAAVYRAIAEHAVQRAAWALRWREEPREPARILTLLSSPATLAAAIRASMPPHDRMAERWLVELDSPSATIREAYQTFGERLGTMLDSPIGRSLGAGTDAVRLSDVVASNGKLLVRLDPRYGGLSRKIGAWTLVAMLRLAAELRQARWSGQCLFVVDEPRVLEHEGRHLADLFGTARDAGLGLVVADQGIAGLSAVDPGLPDAILRSTAWQLVLRQGSPADAEQMSALFGTAWREDITRSSDGRTSTRMREEARVPASPLLSLPTASGWLRVAPIGLNAEERVERIAVARPAERHVPRRLALPSGRPIGGPSVPSADGEQRVTADGVGQDSERAAVLALLSTPDAQGCRRWTGSYDPKDKYPRVTWRGKWVPVHRLVYTWKHGEIPLRHEVHHTCGQRWCGEVDHFVALPKGEHARQEGVRRRLAKASGLGKPAIVAAAETFEIALFAGVDKPGVERKTLDLVELRQALSTFEVLSDKRRGRCWSPTRYADGARTRANTGVESVSMLVFDMDKVPPDADRLVGVYWLGHTTYQHTPTAPRWRVVVPLSAPVPATQWSDVWRRARAALCPEADPICKDQSRQYYLPAHSGGVTARSTCHEGPLLDVDTLPALPAEPKRPELRCTIGATLRQAVEKDRRRGETYMQKVIGNLAVAPAGGRNAALNGAAWTLGQWIAAGALVQADVEDALYAAAVSNGLVNDDGDRQCWATIRSGISAGLQQAIDIDADERPVARRRQ